MNGKTVLIAGGAGYIGRCTAEVLKQEGFTPVILDNFSTGHREFIGDMRYFEVDLTDIEESRKVFREIGSAHALFHFAAKAIVAESCEIPEVYFRNNLLTTLNLAELALECKIAHFIHSSSCAIYGTPKEIPIFEHTATKPCTPYGASKLMSEQILYNLSRFRGLGLLNLRYFNPAGALEGVTFGEHHTPETHLIPNVVRAALSGQPIRVFGNDYDTPDGTCIRDFIHIEDLAQAHVSALRSLERKPSPDFLSVNLGAGRPMSVLDVIYCAERVFGTSIEVHILPRRPGDPPHLTADIQLAKKLLLWTPRKSVEEMLTSHYRWETSRK